MNKNVKLLLACAVLLMLVSTTVATYYYSFYLPQEVSVVAIYGLEPYVNGTLWTNGTSFNWGSQLVNSTVNKSLDVKNVGNVTIKIVLLVDWLTVTNFTLSWAANNTVCAPNTWANSTMTLTIPVLYENATYTWNTWIKASTP